jgi:drug/metabolite transporter (DMT)-like permease
MPADAFALALAAAVLHALWNVLLARTRDPQAATAAAFCMAVAIFAPVAAVRWRMDSGVWKYVAASAAFELAYVLLLSAAYVRAPLSVFYPIARGLTPVLVLVVAVAALGATTSWEQALGVCAVGAGILMIRGRRPDRAATVFGLTIATAIAGYTLIDNTGVTLADPLAYLEAVMIGPALVTAAVVAVRQGTPALRAGFRWETVAIAPLTLAPYALALYALRLAPAAPVAAVRETSVLFATLLAAVMLKEHVSAWRAAGTATVVAGVVLLVV